MKAQYLQPKFCEWAMKSGTPWKVTFPRTGANPSQRRFFKTEEAAKAEIKAYETGRKPAAAVTVRALDELSQAKAVLPPDVSLMDAVRFFLSHHNAVVSTTAATVCDHYTNRLGSHSEAYRMEQLRWLGVFRKHFGDTTRWCDISKASFIAFIEEPSETYWNRYARNRLTKRLCYLAHHVLNATQTDPLAGWKREDKAPIYTKGYMSAADTQVFLDWVKKNCEPLLPCFVLQLFAGIRTVELERAEEGDRRSLHWEDIKWDKEIRVPAAVAKMREDGVVSAWSPALTNWLSGYKGRTGRICPVDSLRDALSKTLKALDKDPAAPKITHAQNAFRHSFATYAWLVYGFEVTQNSLRQLDVRTTKKHYANAGADMADAKAYFNLSPSL